MSPPDGEVVVEFEDVVLDGAEGLPVLPSIKSICSKVSPWRVLVISTHLTSSEALC